MPYIVIDLEFNGRKHYAIHPMEILEIGAVKLNEHLQIVDTFQSYINPKYPINQFALNFCKIDKDVLTTSPPFPEVIAKFIDFCGVDYKIVAWGSTDFFSLFVDCKIHAISSDWLTRLIDMSRFFDGGLQQVLAAKEIPFVGQHHSALDDALNACELLKINPDIVKSERYYKPDHFKLCTGGIKKKISSALNQAVQNNSFLTWQEFASDKETQDYFDIMNLSESEIEMVETLFSKFYKQTYGRKTRSKLRSSAPTL
ncbi:3'-5' exonuclease [Paenibacillus sp. tmac-D7]|uniref:3'-5' exonuclease n=1 Tax=Paenibacillus sp. tmac-D7 TaxID=2591462 RepID=UPI0015E83688|nr:3'-5' exonuclease [Paenibacillus sp. tmac-D7]